MASEYTATCTKCGKVFVIPNPHALYGGSRAVKAHHKTGHKRFKIDRRDRNGASE